MAWVASVLTVSKFSLYLAAMVLAVCGAWLEARSRRTIGPEPAPSIPRRRAVRSEAP